MRNRRTDVALFVISLAIIFSPAEVTAAKQQVQSVQIKCVSSPIISNESVWLAVESSEIDGGGALIGVIRIQPGTAARGGEPIYIWTGRIVSFPKYVLDPDPAGKGGSAVTPSAAASPAPVTCSEPALSKIGDMIVLDWIVSESDGTISLSRFRSGAFETPLVLSCDTAEPVADCRTRLRAELVAQP